MPFTTNLAQETATLTKWLVSIPSVTHAKGPALISQAIYNGLSEFPYFKNHPEFLTLQEHEGNAKSSVVALVKGLNNVQDTLVLLCHTDTNSPYHYGMLKSLSTNSDELRQRILEMCATPADSLGQALLSATTGATSTTSTTSSDSASASHTNAADAGTTDTNGVTTNAADSATSPDAAVADSAATNGAAATADTADATATNSASSANTANAAAGHDAKAGGAGADGAGAGTGADNAESASAAEQIPADTPLTVGSLAMLKGTLKKALLQDEAILGLGVLESKCATGAMLVALKELSNNSVRLNLNVLFICTSESAIDHHGIKSCLPFIQQLVQREQLNLRLCLNTQPNLPQNAQDQALHLYTGNYGKVEPSFYIIGNSSAAYRPYEGFSASIIAAELIRALELNPKLTRKLQAKPMVPTFDSLRVKEFGKDLSPDGMQVSFNLPVSNLNLDELLDTLKEVAAQAIESAADLVETREATYAKMCHEDYRATAKDAEVVSFSDLLERASHNFKGNLHKALQSMVQKCHSEGLSLHQASITIIERLNELARLPRPSIVVYYTDNFVPTQGLNANSSQDREIFMILDAMLKQFSKLSPLVPVMEAYYAPTDANFLRPNHVNAALQTLAKECPLGVEPEHFSGLNVPTITLGVAGGDMHMLTEYVHSDMCQYLPSFILGLSEAMAQNPENSLETVNANDLQRHLDEIARQASSIADATIHEIQTIERQKQQDGFYAEVTQGTLAPHSLDSFFPNRAAAQRRLTSTPAITNADTSNLNATATLHDNNDTPLEVALASANQDPQSNAEDTATAVDVSVGTTTTAAINPAAAGAAITPSTTGAAGTDAADYTAPDATGYTAAGPTDYATADSSAIDNVTAPAPDSNAASAPDFFTLSQKSTAISPLTQSAIAQATNTGADAATSAPAASSSAGNSHGKSHDSSKKRGNKRKRNQPSFSEEKDPLKQAIPSPLQGDSPAAAAIAAANKAQEQVEARAVAAAAAKAQQKEQAPQLQLPESERDRTILAPMLGGEVRGEPILEPTKVKVVTADVPLGDSISKLAKSVFGKLFGSSNGDSANDNAATTAPNAAESTANAPADTSSSSDATSVTAFGDASATDFFAATQTEQDRSPAPAPETEAAATDATDTVDTATNAATTADHATSNPNTTETAHADASQDNDATTVAVSSAMSGTDFFAAAQQQDQSPAPAPETEVAATATAASATTADSATAVASAASAATEQNAATASADASSNTDKATEATSDASSFGAATHNADVLDAAKSSIISFFTNASHQNKTATTAANEANTSADSSDSGTEASAPTASTDQSMVVSASTTADAATPATDDRSTASSGISVNGNASDSDKEPVLHAAAYETSATNHETDALASDNGLEDAETVSALTVDSLELIEDTHLVKSNQDAAAADKSTAGSDDAAAGKSTISPLNKLSSFFNKLDLKSALNKLQDHNKGNSPHHSHNKQEPVFASGAHEIDVSDPEDEQEPMLSTVTPEVAHDPLEPLEPSIPTMPVMNMAGADHSSEPEPSTEPKLEPVAPLEADKFTALPPHESSEPHEHQDNNASSASTISTTANAATTADHAATSSADTTATPEAVAPAADKTPADSQASAATATASSSSSGSDAAASYSADAANAAEVDATASNAAAANAVAPAERASEPELSRELDAIVADLSATDDENTDAVIKTMHPDESATTITLPAGQMPPRPQLQDLQELLVAQEPVITPETTPQASPAVAAQADTSTNVPASAPASAAAPAAAPAATPAADDSDANAPANTAVTETALSRVQASTAEPSYSFFAAAQQQDNAAVLASTTEATKTITASAKNKRSSKAKAATATDSSNSSELAQTTNATTSSVKATAETASVVAANTASAEPATSNAAESATAAAQATGTSESQTESQATITVKPSKFTTQPAYTAAAALASSAPSEIKISSPKALAPTMEPLSLHIGPSTQTIVNLEINAEPLSTLKAATASATSNIAAATSTPVSAEPAAPIAPVSPSAPSTSVAPVATTSPESPSAADASITPVAQVAPTASVAPAAATPAAPAEPAATSNATATNTASAPHAPLTEIHILEPHEPKAESPHAPAPLAPAAPQPVTNLAYPQASFTVTLSAPDSSAINTPTAVKNKATAAATALAQETNAKEVIVKEATVASTPISAAPGQPIAMPQSTTATPLMAESALARDRAATASPASSLATAPSVATMAPAPASAPASEPALTSASVTAATTAAVAASQSQHQAASTGSSTKSAHASTRNRARIAAVNNNDWGIKRIDPAQTMAQLLMEESEELDLSTSAAAPATAPAAATTAAATAAPTAIARAAASNATPQPSPRAVPPVPNTVNNALVQAERTSAKVNMAITDLMDTLLSSDDDDGNNGASANTGASAGSTAYSPASQASASELNAYTAHLRSHLSNHHQNQSYRAETADRAAMPPRQRTPAPVATSAASAQAAPAAPATASAAQTKLSLSERRAALRRAMYGEDNKATATTATATAATTNAKAQSPVAMATAAASASPMVNSGQTSYGRGQNSNSNMASNYGRAPAAADPQANAHVSANAITNNTYRAITPQQGSYIEFNAQGKATSYNPADLTARRAGINNGNNGSSGNNTMSANAGTGMGMSFNNAGANRSDSLRGAAWNMDANTLKANTLGARYTPQNRNANGGISERGAYNSNELGGFNGSPIPNSANQSLEAIAAMPPVTPLPQTLAAAATLHPPVSNPNKTRIEKKDTPIQTLQAIQPHNPENDAMEPVASSNPGVRIVRSRNATPQALTTTPSTSPQDTVVYAQGGAVRINKRITADQASSLLNHEQSVQSEPNYAMAIEDRRPARATTATDDSAQASEENLPTTIVVRGK